VKKVILLVFLIISSYQLFAQDSVYYVILTSQKLKGEYYTEDGIYRHKMKEVSDEEKKPSIFFHIVSPDRRIFETFYHAEYDVEKLKAFRAKRTLGFDGRIISPEEISVSPEEIMDIKEVPLSFLDTVTLIDLDKEFPTMTYESAKARLEPLRGKKIYLIDRNDIKGKKATLIGVKYITSRPCVLPAELL